MSSAVEAVISAVLGFLYKLPKRVTVMLWWLVATLLAVAAVTGVILWATRPDLTVVVEATQSTLTDKQQAWIDNAQKEVASLVVATHAG